MEKEREYESLEAIHKALGEVDLPKLLYELEQFAKSCLYLELKDNAKDIVNTYFERLLSYERKWYKGNDFRSTVFGGIKSLCSALKKTHKIERKRVLTPRDMHEINVVDPEPSVEAKIEQRELVEISLEALSKFDPPATEIEKLILECWGDDIFKSAEIAEFLEKDVKEIYKATLRLQRKLPFVKDQILKQYGRY